MSMSRAPFTLQHPFLIEEELIPTYNPTKFYLVHIGEVFNNRYQVVGKLGYGSNATQYVALKVYTGSASINKELEVCTHFSTVQSDHAVQSCLRPLGDHFEIKDPGEHNIYTCLVHRPLGISLDELIPLLPDKVMNSEIVRMTIRNILAALDFLHTEAGLFEDAEFQEPIPRKTLPDRTIYNLYLTPIAYLVRNARAV
ncbi:hypothetical protein NUU61_004437 [Penicillium alfredii]|uniref:non-specific serine/threonine protein kinase n=1 Tax=Penicillium alfredii TaxID=1506179 RepID=A0A9W9FLP6_9EURO|nr:uncharacterized protein NUU61_004437 [Penicillium alfredii]KAJ5102215.1 hypothetical protein NUU61_004437 [Penicillium alfredii]